MLLITINEDEQGFFNELMSDYPDYVSIRTEHGFDMITITKVVIDINEILKVALPSIIAAIELVLMYRLQKRQTELLEKELKLHRKELQMQQEKDKSNPLQIAISSDGEISYLVDIKDVDTYLEDKDGIEVIVSELRRKLENNNAEN